jgi:hypothetical protein
MSEARLLSLVLLAVFSAFIYDGILFSIYLLFNIFIIYFLLYLIWKIYLFIFHFLIQLCLVFFLREEERKLISTSSVDMPYRDEVYNAFSYL